MAVTSRNIQTAGASSYQRRTLPYAIKRYLRAYDLLQIRLESNALVALLVLLFVLLLASTSGWAQTKLDDLRYGRPRTFKLSGYVGHEVGQGLPTQFVALNLNRRVIVIEFPGGLESQPRTIVGPYLFGQGEDLTPVTLELKDLTHDQRPELLVNVKDEVLVYINEPAGFRMMLQEEHQRLFNAAAVR